MDKSSIAMVRKIIHIDMDAFFAAVEQRNDPRLKGRPVIVGGDPGRRGVVAACSYEARRYGVHSAMASKTAVRLCPQAVFIRPNFIEYCRVSDQVMAILHDYSNRVEPVSIDEAYIDVTDNLGDRGSATSLARLIKQRIYDETRLTASAGVSYNKFLAKVASDYNKPDGLMVIPPHRAPAFIEALPIGKFYGVGAATEERMHTLGIHTGADLKQCSREDLVSAFGKMGHFFYDMAWGLDDRPVCTDYIRKSIGKEITLDNDIDNIDEIHRVLEAVALRLIAAMESENAVGRTITLKVKYSDFTAISRSVTMQKPLDEFSLIMEQASSLLLKTEAGLRKIRLLGLSISGLVSDTDHGGQGERQLEFPFDDYGWCPQISA